MKKKLGELEGVFENRLLVFLVIVLLSLASYWGVWRGFFQQDEWEGLAHFFAYDNLPFYQRVLIPINKSFSFGWAHFLPLTIIASQIRYLLFGLNYEPYGLLSLLFHIASSYLIYLFALEITESKVASFVSSIFFIVAASSSQAVIWVGTSLPTQLALIFTIFSLRFFLRWVEKKGDKRKNVLFSISFGLIAVLLKETSVFLFVFLPVAAAILNKDYFKKAICLGLIFIFSYLFIRLFVLFGTSIPKDSVPKIFGLILDALRNYIVVLIKGIPQVFLPQRFIYELLNSLLVATSLPKVSGGTDFFYTKILDQEVVPLFLWLIGVFLVFFLFYFLKFWKEQGFKRIFVALLFVVSFFPLAFLGTSELLDPFLPSRNLYIPVATGALVIGYLVSRQKNKGFFLFSLILFVLILNFSYTKKEVSEALVVARERRSILNSIKSYYKDLPEKVIFYTQSDQSYYGLPPEEKILPFQSGLGQTLLVWYYPEEKFPREFFENRFLWPIEEQGYKEFGGRGFGYFRDFDLLKKAVSDYKVPVESVFAFRYNSGIQILEDITEQTRLKLKDEI